MHGTLSGETPASYAEIDESVSRFKSKGFALIDVKIWGNTIAERVG